MMPIGTIISIAGLVILLHAGFSAAHFQQFIKAADAGGDSAPLDATIEALVGFLICVVGILSTAGPFLPIKGAAGGGKSLDSAESTRGFNVFEHRGKALRRRLVER